MVPCARKKDMWGTVGVVKLTRGKKRFSEGSAKCSKHALRVAKLVLCSLPLSLLPVSCVLQKPCLKVTSQHHTRPHREVCRGRNSAIVKRSGIKWNEDNEWWKSKVLVVALMSAIVKTCDERNSSLFTHLQHFILHGSKYHGRRG